MSAEDDRLSWAEGSAGVQESDPVAEGRDAADWLQVGVLLGVSLVAWWFLF